MLWMKNFLRLGKPAAVREPVLHFLFHIDSPLSCHSSPLYTEVLCLMQESQSALLCCAASL